MNHHPDDFDAGAYEQDQEVLRAVVSVCCQAIVALNEAGQKINDEQAKADLNEMAGVIKAGLHDTGNVGLDHVQRVLDDHAPDDDAEHRLTGVDYGVGR